MCILSHVLFHSGLSQVIGYRSLYTSFFKVLSWQRSVVLLPWIPTHVTLSAVHGITGACLPCDCWAWPGLSEVCPFSRSWSCTWGWESRREESAPPSGSGLWAPCALSQLRTQLSLVCPQVSSGDLETARAHIFSHIIVPSPLLFLCCFHSQVWSLPASLVPRQPSIRLIPREPRRPPAGGSLLKAELCVWLSVMCVVPRNLRSVCFPWINTLLPSLPRGMGSYLGNWVSWKLGPKLSTTNSSSN